MSRPAGSPLPPLVALPQAIGEVMSWAELERAMGHALGELQSRERQWLTVATLHRSGLYESPDEFPNVSAVCLSLLESVGKAAVDVELRRAIAKAAPNFDVKRRDEEANRVGRMVRERLGQSLQVQNRAHLGRGEASQAANKVASGSTVRTFDAVAMQVVGWWSLVVAGAGLRTFVETLYADAAMSSATAADVRSLFQQHAQGLKPAFEVAQAGPDHDAVFTVTVTTKDGRTGRGEAGSKKHAQRLACHDYLSRHAPHVLADQGSPAKRGKPVVRRPARPLVDERYAALAARFGCRDAGPFARALIHRSWVYENVSEGDTDRDGNAMLANLGSFVLNAAMMRRRAAVLLSRTTDPDPDVAVALTVPDAALRPIFEALGLGRLVRLSAGLRGQPLSDEIIANMVQATLAASHIQWPDHSTFESHLPAEVHQFLGAQSSTSLVDPVTRLQELSVELDFQVEEDSSREGPDHNSTFRVRLNVRGLAQPISVEGAGASRTAARKIAAAHFWSSAEILTDGAGRVPDTTIARLLLVRHLELLAASRTRWPRWQRAGRLGARMVQQGDRHGFGRWAAGVCDVIGPGWRPDAVAEAALADYFGQVSQTARKRVIFTDVLSALLAWIAAAADADEPATSWDEPTQQLVALSAAQSVWMSAGADQPVAQVLENWLLVNRRRLQVERDLPLDGAVVDARTAAALFRALQECAAALSGQPEPRLSMHGRTTAAGVSVTVSCARHPLDQVKDTLTMRLLCETCPTLLVGAHDARSIQLSVKTSPPNADENWLTRAAYGQPTADDYDAELARLIHDLKNEVTAARLAYDRNTPTRTERLEAQLAASRHMDAAAALASRLRDADMLYEAADLVGTTELAAFMQAYISDLIRRLPTQIRVVPPALAPAVVAIDERALRAVLDNLVKNAEQAMAAGGEITFDYTSSPGDDVVLLEIADTGAGIPAAVLEALAAGRAITSGKREGSGLGLLGVRRTLRRVGGELEPAPRAKGTGWLLTLPTVTEDGQAESRDK